MHEDTEELIPITNYKQKMTEDGRIQNLVTVNDK